MRFLLIFCIGFFVTLPFKGALSQGHGAFCSQADSTAASQSCLKRRLDSAQRRLNTTYQKLANKLEGEPLDSLKELQSTWLRYRDAECMWEVARSENASLKRVNELFCMARVTEDRLGLLEVALDDGSETGMQREYGPFPRWMNVASKENPAVVWDYGRRHNRDLNCDDEDEYIMTGYITNTVAASVAKEGEDPDLSAHFEKHVVVALAYNPPAGKPAVQTFKFPVMTEETVDGVCSDLISFDYSEKPTVEKAGDDKDEDIAPACGKIIKIKNKGCTPKAISWTGKEFMLEIKETPKDNQKEEKE